MHLKTFHTSKNNELYQSVITHWFRPTAILKRDEAANI